MIQQDFLVETANRTTVVRSINADSPISALLVLAEQNGQLSPEAWPALRDLLLASADPQIAAAIEPLRQLALARQSVVAARQALDQGYAAVTAAASAPAQLADAAGTLAALADDLSARAQQLAALHR